MLLVVNDALRTAGLMLEVGVVVDATLVSAPSSTKNPSGGLDANADPNKRGNQRQLGMRAHIGVHSKSGLVHAVRGTPDNINDEAQAKSLLYGEQCDTFGGAGYLRAAKRPIASGNVIWHIASRRGLCKVLELSGRLASMIDQVEHAFRVTKRQIGHVKVRYCGPQKNTAQVHTQLAPANL